MDVKSSVMWHPSVKATYGEIFDSRSYISGLLGPLRPKYQSNLAGQELISSLTKVSEDFSQLLIPISLIQGEPTYIAYEKDIAVVNIYFGESTVFGELYTDQRLKS